MWRAGLCQGWTLVANPSQQQNPPAALHPKSKSNSIKLRRYEFLNAKFNSFILIRGSYELVFFFQRLKVKQGTADGDDVVERRKVNLQSMMGKDKRKEKRGSWGGDFMMSIWDKLN